MCRRQLNKCLTLDSKFRSSQASKNNQTGNGANLSYFSPQPLSVKMPASRSNKLPKVELVGEWKQLLEMKRKQAQQTQVKQQQLLKQQPPRQQQPPLNQQKLPKQPLKKQTEMKQHQQPPVAWVDVVVLWTRSERHKYSSIKLLPPW